MQSLHEQAELCRISYEIIVIDDASTQKEIENRKINSLSNCQYIELEQNIGRSKMRNLLVEKAQYPYLLFLDCDSAVSSAYFIKNYLPLCLPKIVCYGGRTYENNKPADNTYLRWKYGVERESKPAAERNKNPNFGFCSNNFLIDKSVFETVQFSIVLEGYGHEDTLFGLELLQDQIIIQHIDNPLIHLGLENAESFLSKTENGLKNLIIIDNILKEKYPEIRNHSSLIQTRNRIEKLCLGRIFALKFRLFRLVMKRNILGKAPSLFIFDLYRLGYLCNLDHKSNRQ